MAIEYVDKTVKLTNIRQHGFFLWAGELYIRLTKTNKYVEFTTYELEQAFGGEDPRYINCYCISDNNVVNLGDDYEVVAVDKERINIKVTIDR